MQGGARNDTGLPFTAPAAPSGDDPQSGARPCEEGSSFLTPAGHTPPPPVGVKKPHPPLQPPIVDTPPFVDPPRPPGRTQALQSNKAALL